MTMSSPASTGTDSSSASPSSSAPSDWVCSRPTTSTRTTSTCTPTDLATHPESCSSSSRRCFPTATRTCRSGIATGSSSSAWRPRACWGWSLRTSSPRASLCTARNVSPCPLSASTKMSASPHPSPSPCSTARSWRRPWAFRSTTVSSRPSSSASTASWPGRLAGRRRPRTCRSGRPSTPPTKSSPSRRRRSRTHRRMPPPPPQPRITWPALTRPLPRRKSPPSSSTPHL
mmetsp:Transcript_446/g.1245  ORF Transcript_446/g.1245 Transcript_446/m.1245 type:complete len:230 (-) Transcript_446:269-958(-)